MYVPFYDPTGDSSPKASRKKLNSSEVSITSQWHCYSAGDFITCFSYG